MSAIQKEQIYVELREYHLNEFPEALSNPELNDLLKEYRLVEDDIISMLLSFVNGKAEYSDLSPLLNNFLNKATPILTSESTGNSERQLFISKIKQLQDILSLSEKATFKVRPIRKVRESIRSVVTKVTRK